MGQTIHVSHLTKHYEVYKKPPGFVASLTSLLNRQYETVKAVEDISFMIDSGELIGFIGPNGAGKTTTLKMLSGLLYPTSGTLSVMGYKPYERKSNFQKQIALIMGQKNQLWWDLPVWETLKLNKEIYEIPDAQFTTVVSELVEMLSIKHILHIQSRKLSLGERMKAELLAALIHSPKLLLLDEPTIGLDVIAQKKMREFIKTYNASHNATILLTSHYMEDVKELCKRVIIIDKGTVLYDGTLDAIVEKYASHKIITVDFDEKPDPEKLQTIGEIKEITDERAIIYVPRNAAVKKAHELFSHFTVRDFIVEELPIEDIIREIFEKQAI